MASNIFVNMQSTFKSVTTWFFNIFNFIKNKIDHLKKDLMTLYYNLHHLADSNMKLGILHLRNADYRDAIFRFKLVQKCLVCDKHITHYWLGLTYFILGQHERAIFEMEQAGSEKNTLLLLEFIRDVSSGNGIERVPSPIYSLLRDLRAKQFNENFIHDNHNVPKQMIMALNQVINDIPKEHIHILELGCNTGLLGFEMKKRMLGNSIIEATEVSQTMIAHQQQLYGQQLYNTVTEALPRDYLSQGKQYDIIASLNGFALELDVRGFVQEVYHALYPLGYFAFVVREAEPQQSHFLSKKLEFSYNTEEIIDMLTNINFKILLVEKYNLATDNTYTIMVCAKNA